MARLNRTLLLIKHINVKLVYPYPYEKMPNLVERWRDTGISQQKTRLPRKRKLCLKEDAKILQLRACRNRFRALLAGVFVRKEHKCWGIWHVCMECKQGHKPLQTNTTCFSNTKVFTNSNPIHKQTHTQFVHLQSSLYACHADLWSRFPIHTTSIAGGTQLICLWGFWPCLGSIHLHHWWGFWGKTAPGPHSPAGAWPPAFKTICYFHWKKKEPRTWTEWIDPECGLDCDLLK